MPRLRSKVEMLVGGRKETLLPSDPNTTRRSPEYETSRVPSGDQSAGLRPFGGAGIFRKPDPSTLITKSPYTVPCGSQGTRKNTICRPSGDHLGYWAKPSGI